MPIAYATLEDLKNYLGAETLSQLIENPTQIESFLGQAQSLIETYLAKAYVLPVERESILTHATVVIASMMVWNQSNANDIPQKFQNAYLLVMNMLNSLAKEEIYLHYTQTISQKKRKHGTVFLDSSPSLFQ